jgi:hypothetical protein
VRGTLQKSEHVQRAQPQPVIQRAPNNTRQETRKHPQRRYMARPILLAPKRPTRQLMVAFKANIVPD